MGLIEIVILATIQGLTEFLPVSSSGHLAIVAALLDPSGSAAADDVVEVEIVLHLGTLLSILVFYWHRICRLLGQDRRTLLLLLVGTIPAAAVGLPLKSLASDALSNPLLAGCMLPITGLLLLAVPRLARGSDTYQQLGYRRALWIGIAQAFAILPGISRSGATIATGLANRLDRESAATFSFLLAIPAISGAGLVHLIDLAGKGGSGTQPLHLAIGAVVSFAVGLLALWWVVRWLEQGRLQLFAWWCIPVGIAVIIWQLVTLAA